jgi:putative ABC transport system permease protein
MARLITWPPQNHRGRPLSKDRAHRNSDRPSFLTPAACQNFGTEYNVEGVSEQQRFINDTLIREHLLQRIAALFGTLSLLLAALGLYAVMNYSILQRRQEIGVRIALGADPGRIVRSLMKDAGALVFLGTAAGILIAAIATRALKALLFGLTPTDPTAFLAATFILVAVALLAAWIPSWRASVTDPMIALRQE